VLRRGGQGGRGRLRLGLLRMTAVPITSDILDAVSGERMAATVAALAGDGFAGRRVGAAGAPRPAPGSVSTWPRSAPPSPSSRSPALIASTGAFARVSRPDGSSGSTFSRTRSVRPTARSWERLSAAPSLDPATTM